GRKLLILLLPLFRLPKCKQQQQSNGVEPKQRLESKAFTPASQERATLTGHSAVEELSFARAKKRGPKKHAPAFAPTALRAAGPLRRRDFSTRHPCLVEKRRASLHVALRVFPTGSVATERGSGKSKAGATAEAQAAATSIFPTL